MKPTVFVVDDDPSVRKSLQRLLALGNYSVKTFERAQDFYHNFEKRTPSKSECLVLDVSLPDANGITIQQEFLERGVKLPIVFITGRGNIPMGVKAIKDGAIDFLPKPYEAKNLMNAVAVALEKDVQWRKERSETETALMRVSALTPRELDVFRCVIAGMANKQIARKLGTTEKTIKVHRGKVMQKTDANSVAELVRLSQNANISPAESDFK